jgi:FtsP/CotA-like multicopper oxidase with cupredoxin domain
MLRHSAGMKTLSSNIQARLIGALLATAAGCNGTYELAKPAPPAADLAAPILTDVNPHPEIVEVYLVASVSQTTFLPGKVAPVWAYRDGAVPGSVGVVPGPTLQARRGDRVIVHFMNELPEDMTVHWHGLRLPNASDGTPSSQVPVPPGGNYDYDFVALDEGTFWYHPHLHADRFIELGLQAGVRILGDQSLGAAADRLFVLDDVKLEGNGQLSQKTDLLDIMVGRQGNFVVLNGRSDARLAVKAGTRERWRFVNSANGRYFNLRVGNRPFLVVGWDAGLLPQPYETGRLLITPGERYEILVSFGEADVGMPLALETVHHDRGHNIPDPGPLPLMQIEVERGDSSKRPPEFPVAWGEWSPLMVTAGTPTRKFELKEVEGERGAEPKFFINDEAFPTHTPIHGIENAVEIWEVHNDTEMDHPFHLHGMFFQVLDIDGKPPKHRGLKDTVNVPQETKLRFAVQYGPPGAWMFHCHILEHAERGMMGELMIRSHLSDPAPVSMPH